MALPSGTVTFLFTDIEGSTKLSQTYHDQWETVRARHHELLHQAILVNHGHVFQIVGDEFCVAFHTALDAVRTAVKAQQLLAAEPWPGSPISIRMGIHSGTALSGDASDQSGGYSGYLAMARVSRLMSAGHGGQVLISLATEELVRDELPDEISLRDLGPRRLKDLIRPEQVFQLIIPGLPTDFPPLKTLDTYRHNLPTQMTSFIGREKEMLEIKNAIASHRLVTLTGTGGTGKTRIALQVAADMLDLFPDGIWLVELAPISDPDLIPQSILSACGVPEQKGRASLDLLRDFLRERRILLLLDNCEHLTIAVSNLANDLLSHSHNLNILATSREPLGVAGEFDWVVPSLSLPDAKQPLALDQLSQYESVQLFIDRALLVQPHFTITNRNSPAIAQICSRLDGIPLAIELAAARVRSLTAEEISARLDDRFRLLTGGARTSLPRQQTLRATLDWSYNLLVEEEKKLLRSLAVFSGGWTLDAAEQVCGSPDDGLDVLDLLSRLVDKSLVAMEESSDHSRYHLSETTRQYAHEKLTDANEAENLRVRHLDFFLQMAEGLFVKTVYGDPQSLDALEAEHDNLRAALDYAIGTSVEQVVRLGTALRYFLGNRGYHKEGYAWAKRLLSCTENTGPSMWRGRALELAAAYADYYSETSLAREYIETSLQITQALDDKYQMAHACATLSSISMHTGDFEKAKLYNERSLSLFMELDVKWGIGNALNQQGNLAIYTGDWEAANSIFVNCLNLAHTENSARFIARALNALGELARLKGDYTQAVTHYKDCLKQYQDMGIKNGIIVMLLNLGVVALHENDPVQAGSLFGQVFELVRQLEQPRLLLLCLDGFAGTAAIEGRYEQAARLFGAAQASHEVLGIPYDPVDKVDFNRCIEIVKKHLDRATLGSLWEGGRKLSLNAALELAAETLKDI